jgi:hypothetical protein
MAGLPGTGLGGIFYVLLVAWMIVRESWLVASGARVGSRWAQIARLGSLAAVMVVALWAEGLALKVLIRPTPDLLPFARALDAVAPALALGPFAILAALILALQIARFLLRRRRPVLKPSEEAV